VSMELALKVYRGLEEDGYSVFLDDRDERAGVKFKDADLIGIPLQVIIGKESLKNNTIELKIRRGNLKITDSKEAIIKQIKDRVKVS